MIRKIILFAYILFMFLLVSLPLNDKASFLSDTYLVEIRLDYLGHIFLFFPFLILLKLSYPMHFFKLVLFGLFFAGLCEGLQYLIPYRSFNVNDLIANMIGIVIGFILVVGPVWGWLEREAFSVKR